MGKFDPELIGNPFWVFHWLSLWTAPYVVVGVAVLVTMQRDARRRHPGIVDNWYVEVLGSSCVVIWWPMFALIMLWAAWKERPRRPLRDRSRNSN
jgi:hypothetical protein